MEAISATVFDPDPLTIELRYLDPDQPGAIQVTLVQAGDDLWAMAQAALPPDAPIYAAPTPPFEAARRLAIFAINRAAGAARARYITVIPGQEMLYIQKEMEASAFIADPAPDMGAYPLITAEIGITAPTAYEVAQIYVNMAALLRHLAAAIEKMRLGAIAAIETASDAAAVEAARAAFLAQLSASGL